MLTSYSDLLSAVTPVMLLILIGMGVRRFKLFEPAAERSATNLVVYLFYPCLIFKAILRNEALRDPGNILGAPVLGFVTIALGMAVCLRLAPFFRIDGDVRRRTFAFTTGIYNYGYIPMPLVLMLWDEQTFGVLLAFNTGIEAAIWTVGILLLTGQFNRDWYRRLANPLFLSMAVALPLNLTGASAYLPRFFYTTLDMMAACSIPLALVLIGVTLFDLVKQIPWTKSPQVPLGACVLRLGLLPALFVCAAVLLPCSVELKRVLIVQAAMPCGIFPIVLTRHYSGDTPTALQTVIGTTIFSIVAMPLWLQWGMKLLP